MVTCTRRLTFETGHRVVGHEGKCINPHGHSYKLFLTAESLSLDNLGRVIDFSVLKNVIGKWIDDNFDHAFILYDKDKELMEFYRVNPTFKHYIMQHNPTAENIALHLLNDICPLLLKDSGVRIVHIKLYETENCFAEVTW